MNEPPPPYSVMYLSATNKWGVLDNRTGGFVSVRKTEAEARQVRNHRNAGYSEGWRDRDEQEQDDG
jgi:hypothetical protein